MNEPDPTPKPERPTRPPVPWPSVTWTPATTLTCSGAAAAPRGRGPGRPGPGPARRRDPDQALPGPRAPGGAPPNPTSITVADALVGTGNPIRDRQFFNTQLNVLHSRSLGERVVKRLKLDDQPPFKDHRDPAGLFTSHVQVEPVPETFVVEVRVTHTDPKEAALWANTLADVYIDYSIEGQVEAARRAYHWVTERLAETQSNMQDAQDKLLKSYQGQELFVPEGSVSAMTSSISKLNEDHVQTQARRITLQSELQEFAVMRQRGRDLDACRRSLRTPTVLDLTASSSRWSSTCRASRRSTRKPTPRCRRCSSRSTSSERPQATRIQQIEDGLRAEYRQLQRREAELREPSSPRRDRRWRRAASSPSSTRSRSRPTPRTTSTRCSCRSSTRRTSRPRSRTTTCGCSTGPSSPAPRLARAQQAVPRGPAPGPGAGCGLCAAARLLRQHDQGRRGCRALPAPRPPGRGAQADQGKRAPGHRGLSDPAHRPALRPQERPRPDPARDGHRPRGGQDHDPPEPGEAPGRLWREHGCRRLRPPPRHPPPAPLRGAGARPHRLLHEQSDLQDLHPAHEDQEPLRAHRGSLAPEPARHPRPRRTSPTSWISSGGNSAGSSWTRRPWPR